MADIHTRFDRPIPVDALMNLYAQTEWTRNRTREDVAAMLEHCWTVGAWDGDTLVGFARAVTDGRYRAFIEDVIVDASYRGQGIGDSLMKTLIERLDPVEEIILSCEDHLVTFYERYGFRRVTHQFMNIWKGE